MSKEAAAVDKPPAPSPEVTGSDANASKSLENHREVLADRLQAMSKNVHLMDQLIEAAEDADADTSQSETPANAAEDAAEDADADTSQSEAPANAAAGGRRRTKRKHHKKGKSAKKGGKKHRKSSGKKSRRSSSKKSRRQGRK